MRTGTGDISIAAAGDARGLRHGHGLLYRANASASVIYTAGEAGPAIDAGLFKIPTTKIGTIPQTTPRMEETSASRRGAILPVRPVATGCGLALAPRQGQPQWHHYSKSKYDLWGQLANFQQGIGALGGGDILAKAGNNINNLSANPNHMGALGGCRQSAPNAANLVIQGGDLTILADGDINSGVFEVDRGNALISAGGSLAPRGP